MSDIARVYPPGQEKALGGQDLTKPYPPGQELGSVRQNGKELAKGNQDLAK